MQTLLVTGGAGFIGSHLVPLLVAKGYRVRVMDNLSPQVHGNIPLALSWLNDPAIEFMRASVCDRESWVTAIRGVTQVIHLAAETGTGQSMYEVARYNAVNSQGTALLFDVLANQPERTVRRVTLASSRSVYGEGAYACDSCSDGIRRFPGSRSAAQLSAHLWEPQCDVCGGKLRAIATLESDPTRPASIYAATKLAQEDLVRIGCESLGMGFSTLRFQNVYGEGQSLKNPYTGILSIFSTRIRRGLELPIFEDGLETRDFVHVSDVAHAVTASVTTENAPNAIINVGSGVATSVLDIANSLSRAFGTEPKVRVTGEFRIGDIRHNLANVDALQRYLGLRPKVPLDDGLRRFAAWVLTQTLPDDQLSRANEELRARNLMGQ